MEKEEINSNTRMIAGRISPGNKAGVTLDDNLGICYCHTFDDSISVTAITDSEYPEEAAFQLLDKLHTDFRLYFYKNQSVYKEAKVDTALKYPNIEKYLKEWKNPFEERDKAQRELAENLNQEQVDQMMVKAKNLNKVSIEFYKKAKKKNQ